MAKAYSDDLRCKILQTYEESDLGQEEVAEQFCVSYGYVKKIRRQQLQSGQMERQPQTRYGPVSRVTAQVEEQLRSAVRQQPDVTLLELAQRLEQSSGIVLRKSRLSQVLERLHLRRKKNPARRGTRQRPSPTKKTGLATGYRRHRGRAVGVPG
jgi:transposase